MQAATEATPLALVAPRPLCLNRGFEEEGLAIRFPVRATRENFLQLRNALVRDVRDTPLREEIEIPYRRVRVEERAPARHGRRRWRPLAARLRERAAFDTGFRDFEHPESGH